MDDPFVLGADRAGFVDRVAEHIHDAPERRLADRHLDAFAGVGHDQTALEAVGRAERDRAHDAVAELLLDFQRDRHAVDLQRVVHLRHGLARELDVDDGADDLYDFALVHGGCLCFQSVVQERRSREWSRLRRSYRELRITPQLRR